jgi:hypothetical protein
LGEHPGRLGNAAPPGVAVEREILQTVRAFVDRRLRTEQLRGICNQIGLAQSTHANINEQSREVKQVGCGKRSFGSSQELHHLIATGLQQVNDERGTMN